MNPTLRTSRLLVFGAITVLAGTLVGCRGERSDNEPRQFFPDMDEQPKYKAQSASTFFADGRTMREPVRGTVAWGRHASVDLYAGVDFSERDQLINDDPQIATGKASDEAYLERTPVEALLGVPVTDADFARKYESFLALGEKKYNIYCVVCHGGVGDGKGTVGTRWSYGLPSFHAEQYQRGGEKGQDGLIFHTILNGVANTGENMPYPLKMPGYRGKVSEREAWAIVEYVRVLQKASASPLEAVPERERMDLERRRGAVPKADAGAERKEGSS